MKAIEVIQAMEALASPEKAIHLSRFFKTGIGEYGEGDRFLGIIVPQTRAVVKLFKNLPIQEVKQLLYSPWHEVRLCGWLILVEQFKGKKNSDTEREMIFRFYLEHAGQCNNWDLVDLSCREIVGQYLADQKDGSLLFRLAEHENLWIQRISIVATWAFIRRGDFQKTFDLAVLLMGHQHDLIHKAVGWMLREVGKKDRTALTVFLNRYAECLPRTTLRYAIEHYPEQERQVFMQKKKRI